MIKKLIILACLLYFVDTAIAQEINSVISSATDINRPAINKTKSVIIGAEQTEKYDITALRKTKQINIQWMIDLYKAYPDKEKFFDRSYSNQMGSIDKLAGDASFKNHIIAGKTAAEMRASWEQGLSQYKSCGKNTCCMNNLYRTWTTGCFRK